MENFDNINTGFVKLICAYVRDIQKIDTDDLDDKLSPDSAIIKFLESRTLIHKSIKHQIYYCNLSLKNTKIHTLIDK